MGVAELAVHDAALPRRGIMAEPARIAVLDGYRALAIFMVMAFHYTVRWSPERDPAAHFPPGSLFSGIAPLEFGWLGVELFFVISGFVILMTLERCKNIADFARRRIARLWPALFVSALITTLVVNNVGPSDWHVGALDFIESVLLLDPGLVNHLDPSLDGDWVDGAYWSLAIEVRFYLLAALIYMASKKSFVKSLLYIQLSVAVACFYVVVRGPDAHRLNLILSLFFFWQSLPYFTLGACVYEIYARGPLRRIALYGAMFCGGMTCLWAIFEIGPFAGCDPVTSLMFNALILALFALFARDSRLVRVFSARPIVVLGQASYSLYLLHQNIGVSLLMIATRSGVPYLLALPLVISLIIGVAMLMFYFVELPTKNWIIRQTDRWAI